jgi:ABC-2 type transport system permease protein
MSEDKRAKTDQVLLTAPIDRAEIVLGKYLSAVAVYVAAISSTLLQAVIMSFYSTPDWAVVLGNYIGLLLLGCALVAICMFLSSLTESQVIAAVSGFCASLFLLLTDALPRLFSEPALQAISGGMSFRARYSPFTMGIIELSGVVFFLSIAFLFLCFTVAVLEKKRWS